MVAREGVTPVVKTFLIVLLLLGLVLGLIAVAGPGSLVLLLGIVIYFIPSMVGSQKRNAGAIFLLNLLLGWTLIGWVGALVWAATQDAKPEIRPA
jgi:hypothetical protein